MEMLTQLEMQNEDSLRLMKEKPGDCGRFNKIAETIYGAGGKEGVPLVAKYLKRLGSIHKPFCKGTVPHTKFIP